MADPVPADGDDPVFRFRLLHAIDDRPVFLTVSAANAAFAIYSALVIAFVVEFRRSWYHIALDVVFFGFFLVVDSLRCRALGRAAWNSPAAVALGNSILQALLGVASTAFLIDINLREPPPYDAVDSKHIIYVFYIACSTVRYLIRPSLAAYTAAVLKLEKIPEGKPGVRVAALRDLLAGIPNLSQAERDSLAPALPPEGDGALEYLDARAFHSFVQRGLAVRPRGMLAANFCRRLQAALDEDDKELAKQAAADDPYSPVDVMRSCLRRLATADPRFFAAMVCSSVLVAVIGPIQAYLVGRLSLNLGLVLSGAAGTDALNGAIAGIICMIPAFVLATFSLSYCAATLAAKALANMRTEIHSGVITLPALRSSKIAERYSKGLLLSTFSGDVAISGNALASFCHVLLNPSINVFVALIYIAVFNWQTAAVGLCFTFAILSGGPQGWASARSREQANAIAGTVAAFQSALDCRRTVAVFDVGAWSRSVFGESVAASRAAQRSGGFAASLVSNYVQCLVYAFVAIQTAAAASVIARAPTKQVPSSVNDFVSLASLYTGLFRSMSSLGSFALVAVNSAGSMQRVDTLIKDLHEANGGTQGGGNSKGTNAEVAARSKLGDEEKLDAHEKPTRPGNSSATDSGVKPPLPPLESLLELTDVVFRYRRRGERTLPSPILDGLSLRFPRGTYTCLVGLSGSGKTTSLMIMLGLVDPPESGTVAMDGRNVADYSLSSYLSQIAAVFADAEIFAGTIEDNIRLGDSSRPESELHDAARAAGCLDWILGKPEGFRTRIGNAPGAVSTSSGQAQRICLARALFRKPRVLFLDEATSNLDPETERGVVRSLLEARDAGTTVVSVTHRYDTAVPADKILVLSKGKLAEEGTFADLASKEGGVLHGIVAAEQEEPK
ncbi:hypothetical protein DFJ74DRAFT_627995 [Hyaloraphidium curvatum]|nr:hypothetical protein DFJ74DRAFT_627995 [Hyaloraphidium curvatum]